LHFPDGELIRTTPEHPFFVEDHGWTPAGALKAGDRIVTLIGDSVPVSEVYDTGEWEVVYNLRVAEYHTYFVGDEHWGFAAWAHNWYISDPVIDALAQGWDQAWSKSLADINRSVQQLCAWALRRAYSEYGANTYGSRAETLLQDGLLRMKASLDRFESAYNVEWQPASVDGKKVAAFLPSGAPRDNGLRTRLDVAVTILPTEMRSKNNRPKNLQAPLGTKLPGSVLYGYDISLNDGTSGDPKPYVERDYTRNFFGSRAGVVYDLRLVGGTEIYRWHQVFSRTSWTVTSETQDLTGL
jgi:intein/homing endonuclease